MVKWEQEKIVSVYLHKIIENLQKEVNYGQKETNLCFFRANGPVFYCSTWFALLF